MSDPAEESIGTERRKNPEKGQRQLGECPKMRFQWPRLLEEKLYPNKQNKWHKMHNSREREREHLKSQTVIQTDRERARDLERD